ncbi:MAG TPA: thioredoxin domain-containing protein [Candidatus Moranbacteria bacterium]|nr:thioredoxin domain-containing protein [Candidatus Moranbacteria bacterium]
MICIISFIMLSILGIFSASHRALAREAFDCVLRRITFRPCNATFKDKMKGKIVGKLMKRSVFAAKLFNKYLEAFSWIFFILMVASTFWAIKGAYNFYQYGSCNGLNQSGFCVFDPTGENNKISTISSDGQCSLHKPSEENLRLDGVKLEGFPEIKGNQKNSIVFIGCYNCDYSRKAYPDVMELVKKTNSDFKFVHFPVKDQTNFLSEYAYCAYNQDKDKFWILNQKLFESKKEDVQNSVFVDGLAREAGFDTEKINECAKSDETKKITENQFQTIRDLKIYGTPTVFINGKALVGPKPYRVYKGQLN